MRYSVEYISERCRNNPTNSCLFSICNEVTGMTHWCRAAFNEFCSAQEVRRVTTTSTSLPPCIRGPETVTSMAAKCSQRHSTVKVEHSPTSQPHGPKVVKNHTMRTYALEMEITSGYQISGWSWSRRASPIRNSQVTLAVLSVGVKSTNEPRFAPVMARISTTDFIHFIFHLQPSRLRADSSGSYCDVKKNKVIYANLEVRRVTYL